MRAHATRTAAFLLLLGSTVCASAQTSLRFTGNANGNVDRVTIQIDPHVPADVGGDFTLEFWMKANAAQNTSNGACNSGSGENWITGNIMFDRAIFNHDRHGDYGLAIFSNGSNRATLAFGILKLMPNRAAQGLCGGTNVADGAWHHVAVTRSTGTGQIRVFVDGQLDVQGIGPMGDVSYENGVPSQVDPGIALNVDNFLGIGAEKFDADPARFPSFNGWIDEVRISSVVRYDANFARPSAPFALDAGTAALYHFDEGSGNVIGDAAGNASPGVRRVGTNPERPSWSSDTPFAAGAGTLQLSSATYTASENAGTAPVVVRRSGGSQGAASVNFQVTQGTATAGADYNPPAGSALSWASGDAADKPIDIAIIDDANPESGETVNVVISSPAGASLGTPASATLTIVDNDTSSGSGNGGGGGGGSAGIGTLLLLLFVKYLSRRVSASRSAIAAII